MIDRLLDLLTGRAAPALKDSTDQLQLAVAALLIEAGRMDGKFDEVERGTIERLLTERFQLERQAVQSLIEEARRRVEYSVQYFPFTHEKCTRLALEKRIEIIQMLWTVPYADGVLDPEEDMLVRQIAGLIHVPDKERGLARQGALAKLSKGNH